MSRIRREIDRQVQVFLSRPLQEAGYAYVHLDAAYLKGRLVKGLHICSRAVVVAMGVNPPGAVNSWVSRWLTVKPIRRQLQGCVWQRCPVHFARNLLQRVPRTHQGMVTAALRSVFAQDSAAEILSCWDDLAASLTERFPKAAALLNQAWEDVLAFRHVPQHHWRMIWSTNPLERVNEEIKRRTKVVGIFPNDAAITRPVGAVLLEQDEHWQLEGGGWSPLRAWSPSWIWTITLPLRPSVRGQGNTQAPGDGGLYAPSGRSDLDPRPGPTATRGWCRPLLPTTHP